MSEWKTSVMDNFAHTPNFSVALSYVPPYPTFASQGEDTFDRQKVNGCGASLCPVLCISGIQKLGNQEHSPAAWTQPLNLLGLQRKGQISWLQHKRQK